MKSDANTQYPGEDTERRPKKKTYGRLFARGFFFAYFYHFFIYYTFLWLYPFESVGFSKGVAALVTALAWFGISAIHGLVYAVSAPLFRLVSQSSCSPAAKAFVFAGTWMVSEGLTNVGTLAFPWSEIHLTQHAFLPAIQSASLFGGHFLSFLIVFVNALAAAAILEASKSKESGMKTAFFSSPRFCAILAAVLFCGDLIFGAVRTAVYSGESDLSVNVSIIQGNILSGEKWQNDSDVKALNKYTSLTLEACEDFSPDLILWPESAVPVKLYKNSTLMSVYEQIAQKTSSAFFVGAFYSDREANGGDINAIVAVGDGEVKTYAKRHLVPFGEYLPWENVIGKMIPALTEINQYSGSLIAGKDVGDLEISGHKLTGLVCFDSIFPPLSREGTASGGEAILLATNDSWFKDSAATTNHLAHAVFRAVENGRYVIRAANSGVSALITDKGETVDSIVALAPGYINESAPLITTETVYVKWGYAFIYVLYAVLAVFGVVINVKVRLRAGMNSKKETKNDF